MQVLDKDSDKDLFGIPGEYVGIKKPIKMVDRKTFEPIYVRAGDSIQFTFKSWWKPTWVSHLLGSKPKESVHFTQTLDCQKAMAVDTAMVLEIKDEFGLEVGCGILIGESKK